MRGGIPKVVMVPSFPVRFLATYAQAVLSRQQEALYFGVFLYNSPRIAFPRVHNAHRYERTRARSGSGTLM